MLKFLFLFFMLTLGVFYNYTYAHTRLNEQYFALKDTVITPIDPIIEDTLQVMEPELKYNPENYRIKGDFWRGFFRGFFLQFLGFIKNEYVLTKRIGKYLGLLTGLGAWFGIGLYVLKASLLQILLWYGIIYGGLAILSVLFIIFVLILWGRGRHYNPKKSKVKPEDAEL